MKTTIPPLDLDTVARLFVYHISERVTTPSAIRPEDLEDFDIAERFETVAPRDFHAAYEALTASGAAVDPQSNIDARWGVLFVGRDHEVLLAAYTDSFGVQGVIDDDEVSFSKPAFIDWLEERFAV